MNDTIEIEISEADYIAFQTVEAFAQRGFSVKHHDLTVVREEFALYTEDEEMVKVDYRYKLKRKKTWQELIGGWWNK